MMSIQPVQGYSAFSYLEWFRLSDIANLYEPKMKTAYLRAIRSGKQIDKLELRQVITKLLIKVCTSTADVYELIFNPNSKIYFETIDNLVDKYVSVVDSPQAQEEVKRILPSGLSLSERKKRLNTFGLDARSAVSVEKYRQERGDGSTAESDTERVRRSKIQIRGNLLAITETNRIINTVLEVLWLDNQSGVVKKADVTYIDPSIDVIGRIPKVAFKEIITRRDDRVCNFCFPLEGLTVRIGTDYETEYGWFAGPPFHPNCRCFQILKHRRNG